MNNTTCAPDSREPDLTIPQSVNLFLAIVLVLVLLFGTFIKFRMIQFLSSNRICTPTVINVDDLILFEQRVNLINFPVIVVQGPNSIEIVVVLKFSWKYSILRWQKLALIYSRATLLTWIWDVLSSFLGSRQIQ